MIEEPYEWKAIDHQRCAPSRLLDCCNIARPTELAEKTGHAETSIHKCEEATIFVSYKENGIAYRVRQTRVTSALLVMTTNVDR